MNTESKDRPASSPEELYRNYYKVIAPLIMGKGTGDGQTTACVMAQAATIDALRHGRTLDKPTDQMDCCCSVLRRMAISINDASWWKDDEERTEILRPLIPLLLDSKVDEATTWKRCFAVTDNVVRVLTPLRLEWIAAHAKSEKQKADGLAGAKELRDFPQITDRQLAKEAASLCSERRAYADAYADAYAYAYAYADAYAYAYAYAYADAQKLKYRNAALDLFKLVAALKP